MGLEALLYDVSICPPKGRTDQTCKASKVLGRKVLHIVMLPTVQSQCRIYNRGRGEGGKGGGRFAAPLRRV